MSPIAYPDPGFVYVLTNVAMPGYVKIGMTRKDDIQGRLRQLYTTGIPHPFECAYAARVPDCQRLERVLHRVFVDKRVNPDREFFTADPELARLIIDLVKIEERPVTDTELGITPEQRSEIENEKVRRAPKQTLESLGLVPGTVLQHLKDPTITCTVADATRVTFQGESVSLSAAARSALHQLGYKWNTVSGFEYWTYEGVKLSALEPVKAS